MALGSLFERREGLDARTLEMRRAIASLMEELEAIDFYQQRVDAAGNEELKAILAHNRDEEKEHAAILMEWLRRNDETFGEEMGTYLKSKGPILELEG